MDFPPSALTLGPCLGLCLPRAQRSSTAKIVMCTSCLHPRPLQHLEMPVDPEFHPHCSLRPRVPLMMNPPSLNLLLPHLSIATCNAGNAYARGGRRRLIGTSFVTQKV
ncbi:similar to RIKEN cDNA 1810054G18 (predicted), isoform CRA_c [Rattus norvegicus]|uniref:Similar to RIKEN cDNA 1810054G18 (Predicted), isoform CRA_c n=1 Tax=Rattus norvegicus TaxID=10116 RepID=A6J9Y8_RAT|nr:similar to RIKEN cDNA 1810054G18 (predicted), isoform CRA_c [Rattus norvegicus]